MHPFSSEYTVVPQEESFEEKDVERVSTDEGDKAPRPFLRILSGAKGIRLPKFPEPLKSRRSRKWGLVILYICSLLASYVLVYFIGLKNRDIDQVCLEKTSVFCKHSTTLKNQS